jgi:hypothetical protein
MSETAIQQEIRLALGAEPDLTLWRNNVGTATHWNPGTGKTQSVKYGLCVGSSDLIGILAGRFVALEVKTEVGRLTKEQRVFLEHVRRMGGFAAVVRSADEARAAVQRARQGASE